MTSTLTPRGRWAVLAGLFAAYAASRLVGLDALPGFIDENWHLSWAQSMAEGHRVFRPWQSGKWLSVFANALILPWIEGNPLGPSRALTAAFGAVTLVATWALARRLYDDRTAVVAGLFYVACPFTLFYDRLVLADPVMATFSALMLLASVRLAQTGRGRHAGLTGLALAATVLAKANGVMLLFVPAAAWLALAGPRRRRLGVLALAYAVAIALTAWPLRSFLAVSGAVGQAVGDGMLGRNLGLVGDWFVGWWTLPLLLLALMGIVLAGVRREPQGLLLAAVGVLPLVALLPTATTWYPRYLLFTAVPGLILAARALTTLASVAAERLGVRGGLWRFTLTAALTLPVLAPSLWRDVPLWSDPREAEMPPIDRRQFIDGWPSGYGVRETVAFIEGELERHPEGLTVVMNARSRPTTGFALNVAFPGEPRLRRHDLRLDDPGAMPLLETWARERPTLVVVPPMRGGRARPSPRAWAHLGAGRALETRKPNGDLCDQIYQLAEPSRLGGGDGEARP